MIKKYLKRIAMFAFVATLAFGIGGIDSQAKAPKKDDVNYLGSGKVEVEFEDEVDYKNVKVTVKDTSGKKYTTSIVKKDDDEIIFRVKKYVSGKSYNYTISGVREEGTSSYGKVTGKFTIALSKVKVEDINYLGSGKVEVEFDDEVDYKNAKVTVKDSSGKSYTATITSKDDDELRFKVKNYKTNKTYKFTITGIKEEDQSKYRKATGSFKIPKAQTVITKARAKAIALADAGVKASQVYDFEIEKDDGKWEIEFETKNYEYEYTISKYGKILDKEKDRADD